MDGVTRRPDFRSHGGPVTASAQGLRPDSRHIADSGTPKQPTGRYTPEPSYHPQLGALRASATSMQQSGPGPIQGSFSKELQGLQHRPGQTPPQIVYDAADLSVGVYNPEFSGTRTWSRLDDAQLQALGIDAGLLESGLSGFRAGVFTDGQGRYIMAFAGTNGVLGDWIDSNVPQGFGAASLQYEIGTILAQKLKAALGDNLMFTGHSLGGGVAGASAAVTGSPAITFNAAGVHDGTLQRHGLDPGAVRSQAQNGQIHNYTVNGEPLTGLQEDSPLSGLAPDAMGTRIPMEAPARPQTQVDPWNPAENIKDLFGRLLNLHSMDSVQDALDKLRPPAAVAPTPQRPSTGLPLGSIFGSTPSDDHGPGRANYLRNLRQSFDDYSSGQGHGGVRDRVENNTSWFGSGTQGLGPRGDRDGGSSSDRSESGRSGGSDRNGGVSSGSGSSGSSRDGSNTSRGGGIGSDYGADRSRDNPGRDRGGIGGDYGRDGSGSRSSSGSNASGGGIGSDYGADRSRDNPGPDRGGIGGDYGTDGSGSRSSGADRSRDGTGGNGDYGDRGAGMV